MENQNNLTFHSEPVMPSRTDDSTLNQLWETNLIKCTEKLGSLLHTHKIGVVSTLLD
jgi:hypothetical protein